MTRGEELLQKAVTEAHSETHPNQAIDPATIITIVGMVLDFIKSCRNPGTAQMRMERGGVITQFQTRRALRLGGYNGNIGVMADALVEKGMKATDEERHAVVADADDVTTPPSAAGGPWTLILILTCLIGFASTAKAGDPWAGLSLHAIQSETTNTQTGPWNLDERVAVIERDHAGLKSEVASLGKAVISMQDRLDELDERVCKKADEKPAQQSQSPVPTPADTRLAKLENSIRSTEGMVERLLQDRYPEAVCTPEHETRDVVPVPLAPARTASSGIYYRGKPITDINAFIKANPFKTEYYINNTTWSAHLKYHGYSGDFNRLTEKQKVALHSIAHLSGEPRMVSGTQVAMTTAEPSTAAVPMQSNCANGNCQQAASRPSGYWKTGWFGRTKWVSY